MTHVITFYNFHVLEEYISKEEITDIIDLFYKWRDSKFSIVCLDERSNLRGLYMYKEFEKMHVITLNLFSIQNSILKKMRVGGNFPSTSVRIGIAMVLVHEIQHANQGGVHKRNEHFYTHENYETRPCEQEARYTVDSNMRSILSILNEDDFCYLPIYKNEIVVKDSVEDVARIFKSFAQVSIFDIIEELRLSGLNCPKNVLKIRSLLEKDDIMIS